MSEQQDPSTPPPHGGVPAHHTEFPSNPISGAIDTVIDRVGFLFSWLWVVVVGVILYAVIGRYAFGQGSVMLEEIEWHLAGAAWLIGLSYTLVSDDHVRVDVLHEHFSLRTQAWVEMLGLLLLLIPFLIIAQDSMIPYFWSSFLQGEESQAPAGLPARWALKFFLPLAFGLLLLAALSRLLKCTTLLFGWPRPRRQDNTR
ncbi:TRAP transporter small permease subunit [Dichotomicrobium thermohalophilum]|uniref:TRAP transporter small permease protein n=1 Tax=Dichotomicrobium thermohalophilum TaxID=933063 RepID=A0A397Q7Z3_9HYPH|nr:TRAP transporter small permease subunit [Dichotomicrobium thermohalophilum]RIA55627.1 TRAP-type mannitol/chloroaromatic compound transport system permease small subunit [Dichotomicrobium thermohalophilum]